MRKPLSVALAVALVVSASAVAKAETLEEAMVSAYETNPSLLARRAYGRAVDEGVPVALSNWRPTVTFDADYGIGRYESNAFSLKNYHQWRQARSIQLSVVQPVYRGGRTVAATKQADNAAVAERYNLSAIESEVLLNVATAYLNTYRDIEVLKLNQNNEKVLKRQLEATEDRFRVGEITRTDVAQAESRLASAKADVLSAQSTVRSSEASYQKSVGYRPVDLEPPKELPTLPESLKEAQDRAALYNPSVLAAEYTAIAAQHNIDLVRGELLPEVQVAAVAERTWRQSGQNARTETVSLTASLTVPLYQAGNVYARIREAKHTAGQRRIEVETARREAVEAATSAWETLQAAKARVTSYEAQIAAAEIALEGVQREAQVGSRTILDVLDAEQELLDARVNLVTAQHDVMAASYEVLSGTGDLGAEKLALPVELYDADSHYRDVRNQWFGSDDDADRDAGEGIPEDYYYVKGKEPHTR